MDTRAIPGVSPLAEPTTKGAAATKKSEDIGQTEFLQLLVAQLKNQDPLNTQDPNEFVKDLAQLTSVERLTSIDEKLNALSSPDTSGSLIGLLGRQVRVAGDEIAVEDGEGGSLAFTLNESSDLSLELFDKESGATRANINLGFFEEGERSVDLEQLSVPDGSYGFRVVGRNVSGESVTPNAFIGGVVSGYIPGDPPQLLIGDRSVSYSDIVHVSVVDS